MPKRRSIAKGFSKQLQRTYRRAAMGPAPQAPQSAPTEVAEAPKAYYKTPKTEEDVLALMAASEKRHRRARQKLAILDRE